MKSVNFCKTFYCISGIRHWDWMGQVEQSGFDSGGPIMSKEQLLLERRQKLQGLVKAENEEKTREKVRKIHSVLNRVFDARSNTA